MHLLISLWFMVARGIFSRQGFLISSAFFEFGSFLKTDTASARVDLGMKRRKNSQKMLVDNLQRKWKN